MIESMLSTIDNPYNPFDDFMNWYVFDEQAGYHSTALLGRLSFGSLELSDADQRLAMENIIDEIIEENVSGMFIKVTREVPDSIDGG